MMYYELLGGVFASWLYFIGVGALLMRSIKVDFDLFAILAFGISLIVGWLVVCVSFWMNLNDISIFIFIGAISVTYAFKKTAYGKALLARPYGYCSQKSNKTIEMFVLIVLVVVVLITLRDSQTFVFLRWDTIVSWNRWAAELYSNQYNPINAAYPVLFPGLWSLIYKAQANPFFSSIVKLSTSIFIIVPILLTSLVLRRSRLAGCAIAYVLGYAFYNYIGGSVFAGYMDGVVALLIFSAVTCMVLSLHDFNHGSAGSGQMLLLAAIVLGGAASVSKQAGAIMLPVGYLVIFITLQKKWLSRPMAMLVACVLTAPIFLYYLIYFNVTEASPVGNITGLISITEARSSELGFLKLGLDKVLGFLPLPVMVFMIIVGLLNFVRRLGVLSSVGMMLFIFFIVGFVVYAYCCSYGARNGWWLLGILFGSVLCQILTFKNPRVSAVIPVLQHKRWWDNLLLLSTAGLVFILVTVSGLYYFDIKGRESRYKYKKYDPTRGAIFDVVKSGDIVVSTRQPLAFLEPFQEVVFATCGDLFLVDLDTNCLGIELEGLFNPCSNPRVYGPSNDVVRPSFMELLECSKGDVYVLADKRTVIDGDFLPDGMNSSPLEKVVSYGTGIYRVNNSVMIKLLQGKEK